VIANANATVGSIGVVVALMDTSKAYEQAGIKKIYITAGANKVPFDEDGSFKKSFLQEIQADIDRLYEEFTSFVSIHTGLDTATIKSFEAGTFDGKTAVEKGLVNRVMTNKEFAAYVEAIHKGSI
jgi:protease-4